MYKVKKFQEKKESVVFIDNTTKELSPLTRLSGKNVLDNFDLLRLKNESEILDFFKSTLKTLPSLVLFNVASVSCISTGTIDLTFQYLKINNIAYYLFRWSNQPEKSLTIENYKHIRVIEMPNDIETFGGRIKDLFKDN